MQERDNRFYLHEVIDENGNLIFKTKETSAGIKTGVAANDGVTGAAEISDISIPETAENSNPQNEGRASVEVSADNENAKTEYKSVQSENGNAHSENDIAQMDENQLRRELRQREQAYNDAMAVNDPDFDYTGTMQRIQELEMRLGEIEGTTPQSAAAATSRSQTSLLPTLATNAPPAHLYMRRAPYTGEAGERIATATSLAMTEEEDKTGESDSHVADAPQNDIEREPVDFGEAKMHYGSPFGNTQSGISIKIDRISAVWYNFCTLERGK